jgi:hypothetical protein
MTVILCPMEGSIPVSATAIMNNKPSDLFGKGENVLVVSINGGQPVVVDTAKQLLKLRNSDKVVFEGFKVPRQTTRMQ